MRFLLGASGAKKLCALGAKGRPMPLPVWPEISRTAAC
jgi:hypothetical protein